MHTNPLLKKISSDIPVWTRVPGTPFSFMGTSPGKERLPGMTDWAERPVIERVGKGLEEGQTPQEISEGEGDRGLLSNLVGGGVVGGTAGALGGRLAGGQAVTNPIMDLWKKGLTRSSLKGLKNVPGVARALPVAGTAAGLLGGQQLWDANRQERMDTANQVSEGLLKERILQQKSLQDARQAANPVLNQLPTESASMPTPLAVSPPGATGA